MTSSSKYTLLPSEPDDGGPINHEYLSETEANADKIDSSSNERRSRWRRVLALLFVFVFLLMSTGVLLFFIRRPSPERQEHDPTDHLENIAGDTRLEVRVLKALLGAVLFMSRPWCSAIRPPEMRKHAQTGQ